MSDLQRSVMIPDGVAPPGGKYTHAIRVRGGELLFISGQVAINAAGDFVGKDDVVTQTRQVFENLGHVLKTAGGSFADVVELMYYIVGRSSVAGFMEARTAIFDEAFPDGNYPTATLLVVEGLASEDFLVEVSAVAALP